MNIKILDGGMGTLLRDKYNNKDQITCSLTPYLNKRPNDIINAHKDFLKNGSDIIITNNYCCTPYYLKKKYKNKIIDLQPIIKDLAGLAKKAVKDFKNKIIFGSVPPFGESYNCNINISKNLLYNHYLLTIETLEPYVDEFICETIASGQELDILLEIYNKKKNQLSNRFNLSFCVFKTGKHLLDKTPLCQVAEKLKLNKINTIFFNCSPIEYVDLAINYITDLDTSLIIGVYPNKHTSTIENLNLSTKNINTIQYNNINTYEYGKYIESWINNSNIKFIGGCCGMDYSYIKTIDNIINNSIFIKNKYIKYISKRSSISIAQFTIINLSDKDIFLLNVKSDYFKNINIIQKKNNKISYPDHINIKSKTSTIFKNIYYLELIQPIKVLNINDKINLRFIFNNFTSNYNFIVKSF